MRLGVMGAMPEEIADIVGELEGTRTERLGGRDYITGRWHGLDVVLVFSRYGKVAAAATVATLLSRFGITGLLFIGVAGGADPALNVGDIVVADELLQHDMDASAIPIFQRFEIPLLGRARFAAHPPWVALARETSANYVAEELGADITPEVRAAFGITIPRVVGGLVASGDHFVHDAGFLLDLRQHLPDLACVEMEGGAVAQVCFEFDIPCVVLRVISDRADGDAPVDFQRFVAGVASVMTARIASRFVERLATDARG